jgi:uncharacterized membrane protein YoaK (UPF0700 family)
MFRHQGPARSERDNRRLAAFLAFIGGFVNSCGFVLIGVFTSHVTGNVGRLANDLVTRDAAASIAALAMIGAFFMGAFVASMMVESNFFGRTPTAYGTAMVVEATLLAAFLVICHWSDTSHPRHQDAKALLLCAAMGMQNSLVTRLSGSVVRTTHLTGVVTDLGIEAARWFRWWRGHASNALHVKLSFGRNPPEKPNPGRSRLLLTITGAFMSGAVVGACLATWIAVDAMSVPVLALLLGATYALISGRDPAGIPSRPSPHN